MAFQKNQTPRYAKGFSEAAVYDVNTGDLLYWTNKLKTGSISTSMNNGAVEGGVGNKLLTNIPDTVRVTGTFEAANFSFEARGLQMGSTVHYNAKSMVREMITATETTLTVSRTPAPAHGQASTAETYNCYVGNDGVNYGVDPTTKQVQGFTAVVGQKYCVQYYTTIASAESLPIPANFSPTVGYMVVKTPMYAENGANAANSSLAGFLYSFYPRVQFIGGDAGINGSQTEASTTSLNFEALAYDEVNDTVCADCGAESSLYGYLTYVPCGNVAQAVSDLVVIGGSVNVTVGGEAKGIPVKYIINNELVQPQYTDLTYTSQDTATATVSADGKVTGVAAGSTKVTIIITSKPSISTEANITVVSGS